MPSRRDPIQRVASDDLDLYDIVDWEPRSLLDRVATVTYAALASSLRLVVVLLALAILLSQFLLSGIAAIRSPMLGVYILLSVVPALLLAGYVWKVDVTMREPLELLVGTFVLGVLFAGFAAIINSAFRGFFAVFGGIGLVLFFFLVVAPIEETVKWLAVRLFAYRSGEFDSVIDGAVYGAVAGLGFATIENTIYIVQPYLNASAAQVGLDQALQTAAVRTFAGPGHVIYSAFAGYYLGLAKFNPGNRGPIVVKGLLIAAFIHATYNSIVSNLGLVVAVLPDVGPASAGLVFIAFILVYDGVFFLALYRKLSAYRNAFVVTGAGTAYGTAAEDDLPDDDAVVAPTDRDPVTGELDETDATQNLRESADAGVTIERSPDTGDATGVGDAQEPPSDAADQNQANDDGGAGLDANADEAGDRPKD